MRAPAARLPAPMPEKITRELLPSGLRLTWRWYSIAAWGLAFFCVFWDGFLVFWYAGATAGIDVSQGFEGLRGPQLMMLLFPLLHVGVGLGITYFTACKFLNRTVVDVSPREIRVTIGPLPWPGNRSVAPLQVAQVYREEIVRNTKNGQTVTYSVSAALKDGKKLKLLSGLDTADQALFLEQEIERHLGIRDQPVAGEMRK
jgi:hypothetical protein